MSSLGGCYILPFLIRVFTWRKVPGVVICMFSVSMFDQLLSMKVYK
jgi:hypothetical protein